MRSSWHWEKVPTTISGQQISLEENPKVVEPSQQLPIYSYSNIGVENKSEGDEELWKLLTKSFAGIHGTHARNEYENPQSPVKTAVINVMLYIKLPLP
jgi:hypothetical protein